MVITNTLRKKIVWIPLLIVIAGTGFWALRHKPAPVEFSSTPVIRQDLVQSVEETGQVTAALGLSYGFEMNGRVATISHEVGDAVSAGDIVATIDNTTQLQALRQAQASLASAQAALNLQLAGPSNEERAESLAGVQKMKASLSQAQADFERTKIQAQIDVDAAQKNLEKAENDLRIFQQTGTSQITKDAYVDLLNTIKSALSTLSKGLTEADNILGIDNTLANDDFQDTLGVLNQESLHKAKRAYPTAKESKKTAEAMVTLLTTDSSEQSINSATDQMQTALTDMRELLLNTRSLLDATPPIEITQSELDTLKSDINTALSSVNTDIAAVANAEQATQEAKTNLSAYQIAFARAQLDLENTKQKTQTSIRAAQAAVDIAAAALAQTEASHAKLIAPPREVDIGSLRAEVSRNAAAVTSAQKELDRTKLMAIVGGVVSKLDIEMGENVTAQSPILGIISSDMIIEVDISEADVAKVSVNDPVSMTLDAFTDDVIFQGHVLSIEPAQTEISGVIYYKTKIVFDDTNDFDVRPGMTANITITTDTKAQVLVIPQRAISEQDGKKKVKIVTNKESGAYDEREITVGIRGDDGLIEVTSGLSEGEVVITFIKE